ncbi:MAG: 50S ribosomal protein L13 [Candidatus Nanoarchaeia archaeon]
MEIVIDAKDLIVGRFCTHVAKQALLGHKVHVVNCEQAILSGTKKDIMKKLLHRIGMGQPQQGPYVPRMPDRFVRRTIRGMLPYKQPRGKHAFKRVMCHVGVPDDLSGKETGTVEKAKFNKLPNLKYVKIGDLCNEIGGYNA